MRTKFDVDLGPAGHALGAANGIAETVETSAYISDLVAKASQYAASEVGKTIDQAALANPALSHVYEWNMAGNPAGRLFLVYATGTGRNRAVQFNFTASKMPIPSLDQREAAGEIAPIPTEIKSRLKRSNSTKYVFRQKAQFMEYGGQVVIRPRGHAKIFVPFDRVGRNGKTYAFVDQTTVNFANSKHRGQFLAHYKLAQIDAGNKATRMVEQLVESPTKEVGVRMGKTRAKKFEIGFAEGQNYARNRMKLPEGIMN